MVPAPGSAAPSTGVLRRLFPVPRSRMDAARTWLTIGARSPSRARAASGVLLLRDSPQGLCTWLGYRGAESPLGEVSFAGGSCEPQDEAQVRWFGPTPSAWAAKLGLDDHLAAKRHVVAAIRELFEETGILLAGQDELSLVEDTSGPEWMRARLAVAQKDVTFSEFLDRRGLGVRTDLLRALGRWLSPDFELRRFDTIYFAVAAPSDQDVCPLEGKSPWGRWVSVKSPEATPQSTVVGDEIGRPETVGVPLASLTTPAVSVMLEKLRRTRGCVAYLSSTRQLGTYQPALTEVEGSLFLDVTTVDASEGGAVARGR